MMNRTEKSLYKEACTESVDLCEYTLFVPCVSVGNVSQLTVDLLVTSLRMRRIGFFYDDSLLPIVGSDPYGSGCNVATSCEVFAREDKRLAVVQQRAPTVKGKRKQFVRKLCAWIKEQKFNNVVLLASMFAHERRDMQLVGPQLRYFLTSQPQPSVDAELHQLGWRRLETRAEIGDATLTAAAPSRQSLEGSTERETDCHGGRVSGSSVDRYFLPGSGSLPDMCAQCEELGVPTLSVVSFCSEGDNAADAVNMAAFCNSYFRWLPLTSEEQPCVNWTVPSSWQLQYGSRFQEHIY